MSYLTEIEKQAIDFHCKLCNKKAGFIKGNLTKAKRKQYIKLVYCEMMASGYYGAAKACKKAYKKL